jgi:hypothetical protein
VTYERKHRPPQKKEQRSWYENALLLAVAGSLIAVAGQLAGTVIPIAYGPQDVSDFSVSISPISIPIDPSMHVQNATVKVQDLHKYLRSYKFSVLLKSLGVTDGIKVIFLPHEIHPGEVSQMYIIFPDNISALKDGQYEITIQGVGGNGKTRNTTLHLQPQNLLNDIEARELLDKINKSAGSKTYFDAISQYIGKIVFNNGTSRQIYANGTQW